MGNGFYDGLKGHRIVGGGYSIGIAEINFVLARAFLVVRTFRADSHLFQRKADFPPDVFAAVIGKKIHISGSVVGTVCRLAVFVQLKEVKLLLRSEIKAITSCLCIADSFLQQAPRIAGKDTAVGIRDIAKHAHNPAMLRPPGKRRQSFRIRMEKKIRMRFISKTGDRGSVQNAIPYANARGSSSAIIEIFFCRPNYIAKAEAD